MSTGTATVAAAGIDRLGDAADIHPLRLRAPVCGAHQVILDVEAVAVNQVDTFVRSGVYATELDFPVAVGRDAVGTIVAVGDSVSGLELGQRAWTNSLGFAGRPGASAERVAVDAERTYLLPPGVNPVTAAAALHPGATAALALQVHGNLGPGETVNMLLATGSWTARHLTRGSLADAGWAHAQLESGKARGTRIVLQPMP